MKILLSCLLFSVVLLGRENPFEPTDTFNEKKQQLLEQQANEKKLKQQQEELQMLALKKEQEKKKVEQLKAETKIIPLKKEQPEVKPVKVDLLKFVSLNADSKSLNFSIDKKYPFINLLLKPMQRKFVFDFRGNLSFYTKREKLDHPYFESITIGTHPKENFFRIVVVVKDEMRSYKETIKSKDGVVSITKL